MGAIRTITRKQEQLSGMPLGGLGTGSVEIRSNGCLEDWEIFNLGKWACTNPEESRKEDLPGYGQNVLPFYIRTEQAGEVVVRRLCHSRDTQGFRTMMYSFIKNVDTISWTPDFPICHMEYEDSELPVKVGAEFASPFIPHDTRTSGMPGFYITFKITNDSAREAQVSVMGTFKNPVNRGLKDRRLKNKVIRTDDRTTLLMGSGLEEKREQNGSIALSVAGGQHSYIMGDYADFLEAYVLGGEYGISEESCLFDFRDRGVLPDLGWEEKDESFLGLTPEAVENLEEARADELLESVKRLASGLRPWKRLREVRPDLLEQPEGKRKLLRILLEQYQEFEQDPARGFGDTALCSRITLAPGASREIRFLVTWHFPNHVSTAGSFVGHRYCRWHGDAGETAGFLMEKADEILKKVRCFSDTLQNCSAPGEFTRSWVAQAGTLIKCSWWAENGDFGIWEGLGSCGFHTTDISYYGSFMLLALFPELQLGQMRMGLKFQREDGRVHHFFTPDFEHVDDGYERVDMNPQFVLMVCRDYLWTGNRAYLEEMWQPVVLAMDSIEQLDSDGDGLPDRNTGANTYDAWKLRGTPSYIAGLWLAALSAASELAGEMGEQDKRNHWNEIYEKGKKSFQTLWNGEYFSLWKDGEERDECLMSGQLDAAWYCRLIGIPGYVEEEQIASVLEKVWEENYTAEGGLVNASYPRGKTPTLYTYGNVQVESNWSGVEFAIAGMLLEMGRREQARELAGNVENRHYRAGRIFNHEECGEHYYRPLSAWTLMLSLGGLKFNFPRREISVKPAESSMVLPWFTPEGYGVMEYGEKGLRMRCLEGSLSLRSVRLPWNMETESIRAAGEAVAFTKSAEKLSFDREYRVHEGGCLEIVRAGAEKAASGEK